MANRDEIKRFFELESRAVQKQERICGVFNSGYIDSGCQAQFKYAVFDFLARFKVEVGSQEARRCEAKSGERVEGVGAAAEYDLTGILRDDDKSLNQTIFFHECFSIVVEESIDLERQTSQRIVVFDGDALWSVVVDVDRKRLAGTNGGLCNQLRCVINRNVAVGQPKDRQNGGAVAVERDAEAAVFVS